MLLSESFQQAEDRMEAANQLPILASCRIVLSMIIMTHGRQADGSSGRRWIILVEDGRYSTLGRASDPSEQEIRRAEEALREQGLSGDL